MPNADRSNHRLDLYVLLGIAALIVLALTRPTNGPVIAPVIIQGEANRVRQDAPLPQDMQRDNVPAMFSGQPAESAVFHPGDRVPTAGVYFPSGKIARREPTEGVATGLIVAHEAHFEVGELLPELTGYEAGAVWVRESAR